MPYLKNSVDVPAGRPGRARSTASPHAASRRSACGPRCRTTSRRRLTRRPAWRCSTGCTEVAGLQVEAAVLRDEGTRHGAASTSSSPPTPSTSPCCTSSSRRTTPRPLDPYGPVPGGPGARRSLPATCPAATSWPPSWSDSSASRAARRTLERSELSTARSPRRGRAAGRPPEPGDEQHLDQDVASEPAQLEELADAVGQLDSRPRRGPRAGNGRANRRDRGSGTADPG